MKFWLLIILSVLLGAAAVVRAVSLMPVLTLEDRYDWIKQARIVENLNAILQGSLTAAQRDMVDQIKKQNDALAKKRDGLTAKCKTKGLALTFEADGEPFCKHP